MDHKRPLPTLLLAHDDPRSSCTMPVAATPVYTVSSVCVTRPDCVTPSGRDARPERQAVRPAGRQVRHAVDT